VARHLTLSCDACGKHATAKVEVIAGQVRRDDGIRLNADLCMACWTKLQKDYGMSDLLKGERRSFEVIDRDAIPRG
jgi:hypothetical protein